MAVGVKRSIDPDVHVLPNDEARGSWVRFFRNLSLRLQTNEQGERVETPFSRLAGILAEPGRRLNYYRGVEDFHFPGTARILNLDGRRPEIVHAHNLHGAYFDLRKLPWISRRVPVVLTLHDAWLLSGHCAHSFGCEKWRTGCGQCPDLAIYPPIERDATAYNWRRKRDIFLRSRLFVSTPAHWLMRKVEESILAPALVAAQVIPNGVDLGTFYPSDQQEARTGLGIPQDAIVLLTIGLRVRHSSWRDLQVLREVLARLADRMPAKRLILIALGEDATEEQYGSAKVQFVPFEESHAEVASYYQAADVYVHAARADTFPSSILEAMACGLPVVATAVGGIPEQIEDARTGFLVPPGDAESMTARAMLLLQDQELRKNMEEQAAECARQKFGLERQVDAYLDWYYKLLS
jgi:glycosyltransferase involved in cell wall biosynthesis